MQVVQSCSYEEITIKPRRDTAFLQTTVEPEVSWKFFPLLLDACLKGPKRGPTSVLVLVMPMTGLIHTKLCLRGRYWSGGEQFP